MLIKRVKPRVLHEQLQSECPPLVIDARGTDRWTQSGVTLTDAIRVPPNELKRYLAQIPVSTGIVVYCDRPHELLSTRVALALKKHGHQNVTVLKGGFSAAVKARLPISAKVVTTSTTETPSAVI